MADIPKARGYEEDFDPDWYLETYCNNIMGQGYVCDVNRFLNDSLHRIFSAGIIHGAKLLDIGTGPSVYSVISASRYVTEIYLSDLVEKNRAILQQWVDGTPNVMPVFEYIVEKENDGTSVEARVAEVREKVKKIYPIDLLLPRPIEDLDCKFDVITSSFCLECVAKTPQEYANLIAKVFDMLKTGGYLVLIGMLCNSYVRIGKVRFDCLNLNAIMLRDVITTGGFNIKFWYENNAQSDPVGEYTECEGTVVLAAQKRSVK